MTHNTDDEVDVEITDRLRDTFVNIHENMTSQSLLFKLTAVKTKMCV